MPGPVQPGAASGGHVPPGQSQAETGYRGPDGRPGSPDSDAPAASRYYAHDLGSGAEPGYSLLAVSDPAADVTSTQTWRAVDDGRATGVWTAPARPDADPKAATLAIVAGVSLMPTYARGQIVVEDQVGA